MFNFVASQLLPSCCSYLKAKVSEGCRQYLRGNNLRRKRCQKNWTGEASFPESLFVCRYCFLSLLTEKEGDAQTSKKVIL